MSGRVYFLGVGRYVKIGHTTASVTARFHMLKSGCPFKMVLLGSYPAPRSAETQLHKKFADLRVRREWFKATEQLLDFAANSSVPLRKKGGATNINIYIPDALGRRLRENRVRSVSLICRRALERELRRLALIRRDKKRESA